MTFASVNVETGNHQKYDWEGAQTVTNLISYLNQVTISKYLGRPRERTIKDQK